MTPKYNRNDFNDKRDALVGFFVKHKPKLAIRLGEGFPDTFTERINAMVEGQSTAVDFRQAKKSATKVQTATLARTVVLVDGLHSSVKSHFSESPEVLDRFGVTTKLQGESLPTVLDVARVFLSAAKENPTTVEAAHVQPEDLTELAQDVSELETANRTQESKKRSSKQATADRDAAQLQAEQLVDNLRAAVKLAFRHEPEVLAEFDSLMPVARAARKKRSPAEAPSDTPATLADPSKTPTK